MQSETWHYLLYGVTFSSDTKLALPAGMPGEQRFHLSRATEDTPGAALGAAVEEQGDDWTSVRAYASGDMVIEWANWLAIHVSPDGKQVRYWQIGEALQHSFEAYIANFAINASLMLQGEETLHSTVLQMEGLGFGLLGDSGAGKSTLAAHVLNRGGELVSDDLLRITEDQGQLFAEVGQPRLKLLPESAHKLFLDKKEEGKWNPVTEKLLFATPEMASSRVKLHALFSLLPPHARMPNNVVITRLKGFELIRTLTASTMNAKWVTPRRLKSQMRFVQQLSDGLPVFTINYERRFEVLDSVLSCIRHGCRPQT